MKKILRKVKISDRPPQLYKWVTVIDSDNIQFIYRLTDSGWNMRDNDAINTPNTNLPLIYWCEEVSIDELDEYKMLMKSNLHLREMNAKLQEDDTNLASERFEKAKKILMDRNYIRTSIKYIEQALRVAAGLEDEVNYKKI